jgi:hypothetical protein
MVLDENGNPIVEASATDNQDTGTGNAEVIADLFDTTEVAPTSTEATIPTEPATSEVTPPAPVADVKPTGEEPAKETSGEVVPATPEVIPPVAVDEVTALKTQVTTLTELVDKLSGPKESTPTAPVAETTTAPIKVVGLEDIFKDLDFDAVMESKENFMKFMIDTMTVVKEQTKQETLTAIPNVVGSFVQRQAGLRDVAMEFYSKYPELKRVKQYVGHVANEVHAEHPDWNISQVVEEAAKRTKETLNIQAAVEEGEKKETVKPKPSLPGGSTGARTPKAPSTGFQDEINDLITD